ncbi:MAG: DoxX family membrane protein [Acidobacteriaceae bacterium]
MSSHRPFSYLGSHVYGIAAIALGLTGLVWGDFASVWQPVPASVPHRAVLAYLYAACLLLAGIAAQWRPSARIAVSALAVLYCLPAALWAGRVIQSPGNIGTWGGFGEEVALVAAAVIAACFLLSLRPSAAAARLIRALCVVFGLCFIALGVEHFMALAATAAFVPKWIPPNQRFWAMVTGTAHLLAGIAIISGILDLLASRLLTAMIIIFGLLVWLPAVIAQPHVHMMWSANSINLALLAAAWVVADAIALRREQVRSAQTAPVVAVQVSN